MIMMFNFNLSKQRVMKAAQLPIHSGFAGERKLSVCDVSTRRLCCISAYGYLFHGSAHFGSRRFDQSGSGSVSVAEQRAGKVNLGFSQEEPTGGRNISVYSDKV